MNDLDKKIAKIYLDRLLSVNNTVTTLELKTELRDKFPQGKWMQQEISDFMNDLFEKEELIFTNNGTFRTYSKILTTETMQPINQKTEKVGITKLCELVKDSKGKFFTLVHKKKDGTLNTMNVQFKGIKSPLGMFILSEQGNTKNIYPNSIQEVRINKTIYKLK